MVRPGDELNPAGADSATDTPESAGTNDKLLADFVDREALGHGARLVDDAAAQLVVFLDALEAEVAVVHLHDVLGQPRIDHVVLEQLIKQYADAIEPLRNSEEPGGFSRAHRAGPVVLAWQYLPLLAFALVFRLARQFVELVAECKAVGEGAVAERVAILSDVSAEEFAFESEPALLNSRSGLRLFLRHEPYRSTRP